MSVGALLGFDESQLTVNEREVLRVLVEELGATPTEGDQRDVVSTGAEEVPHDGRASAPVSPPSSPSVGVDQLTIEEAA